MCLCQNCPGLTKTSNLNGQCRGPSRILTNRPPGPGPGPLAGIAHRNAERGTQRHTHLQHHQHGDQSRRGYGCRPHGRQRRDAGHNARAAQRQVDPVALKMVLQYRVPQRMTVGRRAPTTSTVPPHSQSKTGPPTPPRIRHAEATTTTITTTATRRTTVNPITTKTTRPPPQLHHNHSGHTNRKCDCNSCSHQPYHHHHHHHHHHQPHAHPHPHAPPNATTDRTTNTTTTQINCLTHLPTYFFIPNPMNHTQTGVTPAKSIINGTPER